ncbi:MAG TPA: hypothetical protein VLF87_00195 [Patescibacteria group bacterium]|nr:hypothetical protein [Patescibacteria group bacterium]
MKKESRGRREHPAAHHTNRDLACLFPELAIPAADVSRCNDSWRLAGLTDKGRRAAGNMLDIIDALGKRYARMAEILQKGGTFSNLDIDQLLREDHHWGKISDDEQTEARDAWYGASERLIAMTGEASENPRLRKATYKAYGARKAGIGLHRDSNFPNNDTQEVASVGLRGVNRFSVWAVPESLGLEVEEYVGKLVDPEVGITVRHDDQVMRLKPISTMSQAAGDIVHIDEAYGRWISDDLGAMTVWHSAQRAGEETRIGAIIRS